MKPDVLAMILVQRFLLPFSFAGRWPTESEIAEALQGLADKGASEEDLLLFAVTIRDVKDEAARAMPTFGNA